MYENPLEKASRCRLCGNKPVLVRKQKEQTGDVADWYLCACPECRHGNHARTPEYAVYLWNTIANANTKYDYK